MGKTTEICGRDFTRLLAEALALSFVIGIIFWGAPLPAEDESAPNALDAAVNAVYNAEYDRAESMIRTWLKQHPDDIRAWNQLAEVVLDKEMLRENLYSGAAYLNTGEAFHKREQPLPKGFEARLLGILRRAQALEEQRLAHNPEEEAALYWLGTTHSTRAEFDFALKRSYLSALREGKRAWNDNKELLKIDPNNADAYLVIGIADYAAGILPWYFKIVASAAGIHGDRAKGIQELQRASTEGHYARVDAKIVLTAIYEREKQFPMALALLRDFEEKYPWNYLAPLEIARIGKAEDNWRGAAKVYDTAVEKYVRGKQNPSHAPQALILFRAGEAHEHLGELQQALDDYHEAGKTADQSKETYQADLAAARLDRRFNHLPEARKEYQLVADSVPDTDLGKEARQALQELH